MSIHKRGRKRSSALPLSSSTSAHPDSKKRKCKLQPISSSHSWSSCSPAMNQVFEQPGWNSNLDKLLLDLTVDAHKVEGYFLSWFDYNPKPPLKYIKGWELLARQFNQRMDPHCQFLDKWKLATELSCRLDFFLKKVEKDKINLAGYEFEEQLTTLFKGRNKLSIPAGMTESVNDIQGSSGQYPGIFSSSSGRYPRATLTTPSSAATTSRCSPTFDAGRNVRPRKHRGAATPPSVILHGPRANRGVNRYRQIARLMPDGSHNELDAPPSTFPTITGSPFLQCH
ncbi:unnamed protein product [Trifolium pratense]|uniref:Uncharacterized protein n=1 Tax=Trifolium pratense TaxID=57577 RepID=A0ACB0K0S8_TRIPR|nr:unnamed protein product [Trifolium pratense]